MTDGRGESQQHSRIVDLSAVGLTVLTALAASDDSVFAKSMGYVLADLGRSTEAISGWSSYLDVESEVEAPYQHRDEVDRNEGKLIA